MKQFKNRIGIEGSVALRKAFAQELEQLGYHIEGCFSRYEDYPTLVIGYLRSNGYNNCHKGYCKNEPKSFNLTLPQDWDKALALASEVVEPEVIKTKTPLELLIEEAEKRYPKGTKFTPAHVKQRDTVYTSTGKVSSDRSTISYIMVKIVENEGWSPVVYFNNKWAKIIKDTPKPVTYKRGDRFIREGREYILARESANYKSLILVSLEDGNIWANAVEVNDFEKVTEAEIKKLCAGEEFKLVKE